MPILHDPWKMPDFGVPISISVEPVCGSIFEISKLGIRTADEQSNVPVVSKRKTVGRPA